MRRRKQTALDPNRPRTIEQMRAWMLEHFGPPDPPEEDEPEPAPEPYTAAVLEREVVWDL